MVILVADFSAILNYTTIIGIIVQTLQNVSGWEIEKSESMTAATKETTAAHHN
jgi:nucleoside permease NupC